MEIHKIQVRCFQDDKTLLYMHAELDNVSTQLVVQKVFFPLMVCVMNNQYQNFCQYELGFIDSNFSLFISACLYFFALKSGTSKSCEMSGTCHKMDRKSSSGPKRTLSGDFLRI